MTQSHVGDVMTSAVVSTGPTTTYRQLARLLTTHRISGVPVCRQAGSTATATSATRQMGQQGRCDVWRTAQEAASKRIDIG